MRLPPYKWNESNPAVNSHGRACDMSPINWLLRKSRERWAQDRMTRRTMCSRVHCVYYDPTSLYSGPLVKHTRSASF